ncbi:MAG: ShlB/FhaC/HecB family hemolysin secretion/activation protein [Pseudomonadota bacterium]|nr:ShlB/FhaC/HecB family hemolysin secretion/activation protein [Pseudomonadota bacterium]
MGIIDHANLRFWHLVYLVFGLCLSLGLDAAEIPAVPGHTSSSENSVVQRSDPNEDRYLRRRMRPTEPLPNDKQPILKRKKAPMLTTPQTGGIRIFVRRVNVTGNTVLDDQQIEALTRRVVNRSVTFAELKNTADAITQLYVEQGYLTSRAALVPQEVRDGIVRIQAVEGQVQDIEVKGARRLRPSYVRSRVALGATSPLNVNRLEEELILLKTDPLLADLRASLRPGDRLGQSRIVTEITEADPIEIVINIDNFSPPSIGSERTGVLLLHRNLLGLGDEVYGAYNRTTNGASNNGEFSYRIPFNARNGTLQVRAVIDRSDVTEEVAEDLNIRSDSELFEASIRQPLIRSIRDELALSLGFSRQNGKTFLGDVGFGFGIGPEADGTSRTSVLKFGQDYSHRDPSGVLTLRSQLNWGIDVLDATLNNSPVPDGRFFSWLFDIQRVQRLHEDHLLIAESELQLTPDSLLPSEQYVIGGGRTVRGYRENARFGDNGFRISIEDRYAVYRGKNLLPIVQLVPFTDLGVVWNAAGNPNDESLPSQRFLATVGLGLLLTPLPGCDLRLDYAVPLIDLNDRGDNLQDHGVHFSIYLSPLAWL